MKLGFGLDIGFENYSFDLQLIGNQIGFGLDAGLALGSHLDIVLGLDIDLDLDIGLEPDIALDIGLEPDIDLGLGSHLELVLNHLHYMWSLGQCSRSFYICNYWCGYKG